MILQVTNLSRQERERILSDYIEESKLYQQKLAESLDEELARLQAEECCLRRLYGDPKMEFLYDVLRSRLDIVQQRMAEIQLKLEHRLT